MRLSYKERNCDRLGMEDMFHSRLDAHHLARNRQLRMPLRSFFDQSSGSRDTWDRRRSCRAHARA